MRARRIAPILAIAIALVLCCRGRAVAGPPYQTDDPDPTPYRHYEIYINSQYSHDADSISGTIPSLEINYGLMPNVQFSVTTSLAGGRLTGRPWYVGAGEAEVALKMRFIPETGSMPQISFSPAVVVPSGSLKASTDETETKIFLPLWAQKSIGPWTIFGGGGWWHNPGAGNRDYTFEGLAVERDVNDSLTVGAEIYGNSAPTMDIGGSTSFGVGLIKSLGEQHKVLFSIGRAFGRANTLSTYAAYELYLGPKSKETRKNSEAGASPSASAASVRAIP